MQNAALVVYNRRTMNTDIQIRAEINPDIRAKHLPAFANGDWVETQIRVSSPNKQLEIASALAKTYPHWNGDEEGKAFYDKVAADLAIPGFIDDVMKGAGDRHKKGKKPPFWFILERVVATAGGPKESFPASYERAIEKARKKEEWDSFRDFVFFATLWMRAPDKALNDIRNTPVESALKPFLSDYEHKNAVARAKQTVDGLNESRRKWHGILNAIADGIVEWAKDDPDSVHAAKLRECGAQMERDTDHFRELLDRIETADDAKKADASKASDAIENVVEGCVKLRQIAEQPANAIEESRQRWNALINAAAAEMKEWAKDEPNIKYCAGMRECAALLEKASAGHRELRAKVEQAQTAAELKHAAAALEPFAKDENIAAARAKLLQLAEEPQNAANADISADKAAKRATALAKLCEQKLGSDIPSARASLMETLGLRELATMTQETKQAPPPVILEEKAAPAKKEKQPAQKTEDDLRVEHINKTVFRLMANAKADSGTLHNLGFETAYRIMRGGEAQMPDGDFAFPAAALRLLAFPWDGEKQESIQELEAAVKRGVDDAGKTALFAAALFPAVFFYGAREFFHDGGPLTDFGGKRLAPLRRAVCGFGTWRVTPAVYAAADTSNGPDARGELSAWYEANKDKTIKYAGATHIWQEWMKKEGTLGSVILPLLNGGEKAVKAAEDFLHEHRNDKAVQRLMDAGSAQFSEKKIEGGAKHRMFELFHDCASLVEKAAEEARNNIGSEADEGEASEELLEMCRKFRMELERAGKTKESKNPAEQTLALEACLQRTFAFFLTTNAKRICKKAAHTETIPGAETATTETEPASIAA